jgi:type VI secretion system secreted protein Hcp
LLPRRSSDSRTVWLNGRPHNSWAFRSGKGLAGHPRIFGYGTHAEKDRSSGNWRYTIAAGKAKRVETIAKYRARLYGFQSIEISRRIAMRIVHRGRLFVLCGVVSTLLSAVPAMAAVDAFMTVTGSKQGTIKGDAGSENIHLVSVVRDAASGMATGKRMHSTITITKEIDKASPPLFAASTSHEPLSRVAIAFQGGSGGAKTAQKIVLTNATIVSIRKSGSTEQITFDYQAIEVTWTNGGKTATDDWLAPN